MWEPHTYRTCAFIFVWSSSSAVNGSRARTYDDDDEVAQHGVHTVHLMHCKHLYNLIMEIHFIVNWQLSNQGVRWPEPHGRIAGSSWNSSRSSVVFFKLTADQDFWIFIGSRVQVFSHIIRTSQTTGGPLSGLAKSIYYTVYSMY